MKLEDKELIDKEARWYHKTLLVLSVLGVLCYILIVETTKKIIGK